MKKIPTLFERIYENHKVIGITENVTPGMEWVLNGEGIATVKIDGACCAIINGEFYKRYDAKRGKEPPKGAIPCCDPDPVTGHWPHWVKVDWNNPSDIWFVKAYERRQHLAQLAKNKFESDSITFDDGTYEAIGAHFQGNPYRLSYDIIVPHGKDVIDDLDRTFDGIRKWLMEHNKEGIVFWKDGEPQCKIKRSDFGFAWPDCQE